MNTELEKGSPQNGEFSIGRWRVHPRLNRIADCERTVRLEPKMMELLLCLAEHSGEVLSKDDLMQRIWPGTFVGDSALTRTISELRKAFADDPAHPGVIETIPKRGYRLIAPVTHDDHEIETLIDNESHEAGASGTLHSAFESTTPLSTKGSTISYVWRQNPRPYFLAGCCVLLLLGGGLLLRAYVTRPVNTPPAPYFSIVPLTALKGTEIQPAVSFDGSRVAFVWSGETGKNLDIYVKPVEGHAMVRLTTDPANDYHPAWSPDGSRVAFVRRRDKDCGIYTVGSRGGVETKLTSCGRGDEPDMAWSPDGQWLVFADKDSETNPFSLFAISVKTAEKRKLTSPLSGYGDRSPAFSPDGRTLAFKRIGNVPLSEIYVIPFAGGDPQRLTSENEYIQGLDWASDGNNIVFSMNRGDGLSLWQVPTTGGAPFWTGLSIDGDEIDGPSLSRQRSRLVFAQKIWDTNIWQVNLSGTASKFPVPLISSTRMDANPQFSPDGTKVAFVSTRQGYPALFVCERDGSYPKQLAGLKNPSPVSWSPDGRQIAFSDQSDIFTIAAEGGTPQPLTVNDAKDRFPVWSHDGRCIYFTSDRTGTDQVWKMASDGGELVQLTRLGGITLGEAPNHQFVFYVRQDTVWRVPVGGGEESFAFEFTKGYDVGDWAISKSGIYFINRPNNSSIDLFDFATHIVKKITEPTKWPKGITVSPDGNSILYSQVDRNESDLMLVEYSRFR